MLALAVGWTSLILGVASFLVFCLTLLFAKRKSGLVIKSEDVSPTKLAEALAKLVDAFAKAGPTISALVASIIFVAFAAWIAMHICALPQARRSSDAAMPAITECVVTGLPEPSNVTSNPFSAANLFSIFDNQDRQEPKGCLSTTLDRARTDAPYLILLIGRADKRQLRAPMARIYGDNSTLAYQRAITLRAYLIDRYDSFIAHKPEPLSPELFASRVVTLSAGSNHIGSELDTATLSEDRCVELVAYWSAK
jgi:hypothetical protein